MDNQNLTFSDALMDRVGEIVDACTRCGKCFQACPMTAPAGINTSEPAAVVTGVLDILAGGPGTSEAQRWVNVCSSSGKCIAVCDYGVNPRFMVSMARLELKQRAGEDVVRTDGNKSFRGMSRGVRVLSRLQLPADDLKRLGQPFPEDSENEIPDLVFYTGCNVLKTPHIALLCLDVLDALGVNCRVLGGPAHCCGVLNYLGGDTKAGGRMGYATTDRFAATKTSRVLSWCPTCQMQFGEIVLPSYERSFEKAPFEMTPFVVYLAERLDDLRPFMTNSVNKRVGLHEHPGALGIAAAARRILKAIPGLEFVDLKQPSVGSMCNKLATLPEYHRKVHQRLLDAAEAAKVTTLAGVYHACHRQLCSHEKDWPFEVVNFMELVGESLGIQRPDLFKRLKILQDVDSIIADTRDLIETHDLDEDKVRESILEDLLSEQPLSLGRSPIADTVERDDDKAKTAYYD